MRFGRRVILETAFVLIDLGHPDVGRVADLPVAVHRRLHGGGRRGIGIDGDGVLAAERVLQHFGHLGRDLVAVRTRTGCGPADRLALRCVSRIKMPKKRRRRQGPSTIPKRCNLVLSLTSFPSFLIVMTWKRAPSCDSGTASYWLSPAGVRCRRPLPPAAPDPPGGGLEQQYRQSRHAFSFNRNAGRY